MSLGDRLKGIYDKGYGRGFDAGCRETAAELDVRHEAELQAAVDNAFRAGCTAGRIASEAADDPFEDERNSAWLN